MAMGEILKRAREQRGLTPSAVAESTHMKVQVVEDLEREDFRRIAAPIYGRGFVKLYAEFLQLDPEPLTRDFMELYAGAKSPAVRTRRLDGGAGEPPVGEAPPPVRAAASAVPQPQRQPVQPRPAVRPLSAPLPPDAAAAREPEPAPARADEAPAQAGAADDARDRWVVEPEAALAEADEPDLFSPRSARRPVVVEEDEAGGEAGPEAAKPRARKLPVFKIGGRLEPEDEPQERPLDGEARARRHARVQSFLSGVRSLMDGVERKLPAALPRKRLLALCGAGALLLGAMAAGVGLLFRLTGSNVSTTAGLAVAPVAPPPSLYVD